MVPSRIKVFIVDDNAHTRRAMTRLMNAARFEVVCAESIDELLAGELPSTGGVIVADVSTARQFAATLPQQLHSQEHMLPVIYLTDYDTELTRVEARRLGAVGFFRKPVDVQALVDAITFAVKTPATGA
jgi:FixJ family two-component response regulator